VPFDQDGRVKMNTGCVDGMLYVEEIAPRKHCYIQTSRPLFNATNASQCNVHIYSLTCAPMLPPLNHIVSSHLPNFTPTTASALSFSVPPSARLTAS